jgi:hypothetical protein
VPAHYRDLANRARIPGERTRLQAERDAKAAEVKGVRGQPTLVSRFPLTKDTIASAPNWRHRRQTRRVSPTLKQCWPKVTGNCSFWTPPENEPKPPSRSATSTTADHVTVFTPGMNSTVNDRMEGYRPRHG